MHGPQKALVGSANSKKIRAKFKCKNAVKIVI
jgi:hypothetical protein